MNIQIDYKKLRDICLTPETRLIPEGRFNFIDKGSNILAVAHCDYICRDNKPDFVTYKYKSRNVIMSETLDDRLGVYIILSLLPKLGVNTDILLTTDEEIGQSSAGDFQTEKKYNWIFSFDRRGTDIVAYQYTDDDLNDRVKAATGHKLGHGSFSDIGKLEKLGVKGLNFGTGYHDEHSTMCSAYENEIQYGVKQFLRWYRENKNVRLEHTPKPVQTFYRSGGRYDDGYWLDGQWVSFEDDINEGWWQRKQKQPKSPEIKTTPVQSGSLEKCEICNTNFSVPNSLMGMNICEQCIDEFCEQNLVVTLKSEDKALPIGTRCKLCGYPQHTVTWRYLPNPEDAHSNLGFPLCKFCAAVLEKNKDNVQFVKNLTSKQ